MKPIHVLAIHTATLTVGFAAVAVIAALHDHWWTELVIAAVYAALAGTKIKEGS